MLTFVFSNESIMKKALSFLAITCSLLLTFSFTTEPSKEIHWVDITEIDSLVKANPKPVFIDVRADWCGMCAKMDRTTLLDSNVINTLNTEFYAVHFDFHDKRTFSFNGKEYSEMSNGQKKFSSFAKYLEATGLPTLVFFDQKLSKLETEQGFYKAKEFVRLLKEMIDANNE